MEQPYCGVCGQTVPLDADHTKVVVEHARIADRDSRDEYYLHVDCALSTFDDWSDPA